MITIIAAAAGSLIGIPFFIFLLPRIAVRLEKRILESKTLNEEQKENLLELLRDKETDRLNRKGINLWILPALLLISLVSEVFLLYKGDVSSARIVLIGMFLLLGAHVFEESQGTQPSL